MKKQDHEMEHADKQREKVIKEKYNNDKFELE